MVKSIYVFHIFVQNARINGGADGNLDGNVITTKLFGDFAPTNVEPAMKIL